MSFVSPEGTMPIGTNGANGHNGHAPSGPRRLGVAIVGFGGAVSSTVAAGVELMRLGLTGPEGLPLAGLEDDLGLVGYEDLVLAGWDVSADTLDVAAAGHGVLSGDQLEAARPGLAALAPWPAVASLAHCRNITGDNLVVARTPRAAVERIRSDLRAFAQREDVDGVVVVNLASTERLADLASPALASLEGFEEALDESDGEAIPPACLYAYAALAQGVPFANFTPSVAADAPALVELAERDGVPVAGKDGKTGQTMLKTVLAPGLRTRALRVEGWFSSNILGNRDGLALDDPASLASKLETKGSVLDEMLGYHVEDHVVAINYYRPRGDAKEAWDTIDLVGFLGQRMQLKVNFLCRDSILAAPLVLELARLLDLARRRETAACRTSSPPSSRPR
jgi:myo-inositol-1-phosphate synthase